MMASFVLRSIPSVADTMLLVLVIRGDTEGDEELVLQSPDNGDNRGFGGQFVLKLGANVSEQLDKR